MDRRDLLRGSLALGGLAGLGGCAGTSSPRPRLAAMDRVPPLAPIRAHADRIYDIKCCIRPFRPMGPRLDAERTGDTLVVHNYGHGGSGWSLSWGSAAVAVEKAMSALPERIAVIGCGVIGLSTALTAQRAGAQVTIYARDLLPKTRSVRANGSWTPDSRVSLDAPAGPAFGPLWEQMARTSWKTFRTYVGLPGKPVDFADQYELSDGAFRAHGEEADPTIVDSYATKGLPQQNSEFGRYRDRIKDLTPTREVLPAGETPFPVAHVARNTIMFFNFGSYAETLLAQFYAAGGKVVIREFHSPREIAALTEKVVINCPGYAARDLWADKTIIPVRGQTTWLIPQPEVNYGLYYNGASALAKGDGIMIMGGSAMKAGDMAFVGNSNEVPSRAEAEEAVGVIESLFRRWPDTARWRA